MPTPRENRSAFLGALLGHTFPYASPVLVERAIVAMLATAKAHKSDGLKACNYPRTEAQDRRADKRLDGLAKSAMEALRRVTDDKPGSAKVTFGGDPRGACGALHVSGQPGDGWSTGFAIYP